MLGSFCHASGMHIICADGQRTILRVSTRNCSCGDHGPLARSPVPTNDNLCQVHLNAAEQALKSSPYGLKPAHEHFSGRGAHHGLGQFAAGVHEQLQDGVEGAAVALPLRHHRQQLRPATMRSGHGPSWYLTTNLIGTRAGSLRDTCGEITYEGVAA